MTTATGTEPRLADKEKRFISDDNCHICGLIFNLGERAWCVEALEVKPDKTPAPFVVNVHVECLALEVSH